MYIEFSLHTFNVMRGGGGGGGRLLYKDMGIGPKVCCVYTAWLRMYNVFSTQIMNNNE